MKQASAVWSDGIAAVKDAESRLSDGGHHRDDLSPWYDVERVTHIDDDRCVDQLVTGKPATWSGSLYVRQ